MASLLKEKSILDVLDNKLKAQGFVGPADIPKLVFLSLYTRFFDDPVSMVIKGPSGSGKSFALHAGLQFIPPSAYRHRVGLTPKALVYLNRETDPMQHKYLVIGEAAGLDKGQGQVLLRQLLTEHRLKYDTTETHNNARVTVTKVVEGPIGLLMTTTADALHPEDESRMLSYRIAGASAKVKEALLKGERGRFAKLDTRPWFELHEFVGANPKRVSIPYYRALVNKLPDGEPRLMRDFRKVRALIEAHALMHQKRRKRNIHGYVLATIDDYKTVHDLVGGALAQSATDSIPAVVKQMVFAIDELPREAAGISQTDLASKLGRNQSIVSRYLPYAIEHGYLADLKPGQGRSGRIVLGKRALPSDKILPTPKELR